MSHFDNVCQKVWSELTRHREIPYGILPDKATDLVNAKRDQLNTYEVLVAFLKAGNYVD